MRTRQATAREVQAYARRKARMGPPELDVSVRMIIEDVEREQVFSRNRG